MIIVSIACHPGITKLYYLAVRSWVVDDNSFPKFHVITIKPISLHCLLISSIMALA